MPKPVLETKSLHKGKSNWLHISYRFPKMAVWHDWTQKTFPTVSSFMGATMGKWSNKLIESMELNICEIIFKKESMFDNIWGQDQHTYSFCLIFGMKAQEQRIGKLYDLVKRDSIVHIVKEEYAKGIERIKQEMRSGNPFVSRSSVHLKLRLVCRSCQQ